MDHKETDTCKVQEILTKLINGLEMPKSSDPVRIRENLTAIADLDPVDAEKIKSMLQTGWSGEHPDLPPKKNVQVPE